MDETRPSGVYFFRCRANGKMYVGSGYLEERYVSHNKMLNAGEHYNKYFQHAWNKHGGEAGFEYGVIEECSRNALLWSETFWVLYFRAAERQFGYNIMFPIQQRMPAEGKTLLHKDLWARPEIREKYENASREYWDSAEARDCSAQAKEIMARPGVREKISRGVKKTFAERPESRAKISEGVKRYYNVPANKQRRSEQSRAMWRDADTRKMLLATQKEAIGTPEYRQRMSHLKKKQWEADPTIREKVSASRKAQYQTDPEYVAKVMMAAKDPARNKAISDKAKARWADPEFRKRTGRAISAAKLAKTK